MFANLRLAFSFLTIIPIDVKPAGRKNALAAAMVFFPLVGFCIGLVSLGVAGVFESIVSLRFSCLLLVVCPIILSGGLHIDGLADCFDAFFQGRTKEDILRVMKDSRIGVWGALGVVFVVLIKWELLYNLPSRTAGFLLALTVSRWAHVVICFLLPYAGGKAGLGQSVAKQIRPLQIFWATVFVMCVSLALGVKGLGVLILSYVFIYGLSIFFRKKIGGLTGDVIGATGALTEICVYLGIMLMGGHGSVAA